MNMLDLILIVIIAAAVVLAVRSIRKQRRSGKGCLSCGGSCAGCTMECRQRQEAEHL